MRWITDAAAYVHICNRGIIMNVTPKQTAIHICISIIIIQVDVVNLYDLYIDLVVMVSYNSRA